MSSKQTFAAHLITLVVLLIVVGPVAAQQPSPSPTPKKSDFTDTPAETGEKAGDFTLISSLEVGYRGLRVDGDLNKYQSDLNYKAGPRVFDSSFLLKSTDGKGGLFETFLVTSTGWGADPQGNVRASIEQPKWYRFDATYRRFKYFRFLNTFANPNWVFSPASFSVAPKVTSGEHGYDTRIKLGDFDLTLLPKNRLIRFNVGYSPERYSGPAFTSYHVGGNEFNLLSQLRSRANDFRVGADGKLGPLNFSFLQGFRRFRDDNVIDLGVTPGINVNPTAPSLTTFDRNEPARGSVNYTRFSLQTLVAKRLDITGRLIYSKAEQNYSSLESFTGRNWNPRITGFPPSPPAATPNILNLGQYTLTGNTERPNWLGDVGLTWLATDKFRLSNTFRVETFEINGAALFADFFSLTRGTRTDTIAFNNREVNTRTDYRKIQNTIEGDYQFNKDYSIHLGYRYGRRRIEEAISGFGLNANAPAPLVPVSETEENNTHAVLSGFRARPQKEWTIYFDAEHGTADNVFTRIGNYNYTNIRAKSRFKPTSRVAFNLALIAKNNANPSEIAGVSLEDFGVSVKSRIFSSSLDWTATSRFSISTGYNYHWINSKAIVDYFFNSVRHPLGNSLYFVRNNFFFVESVTRITPRVTLFAAYRINKDNGQGNRVADPTGNPGTLIASYPMSFQSPEARLAIKLHQRLDWNVGYQYYNYNESTIVGPRPQNYHAHLPYTSLRLYFGRRE
jgi:Putative outer membrane beta-barrel porin, MtrB/PioB